MRVSVEKRGNSLAVRIPDAIARKCGITRGLLLDLRLVGGSIVLKPMLKPCYSLDELLGAVTPNNRHGEIRTGHSSGGEAW